jgi:hypothetical protein
MPCEALHAYFIKMLATLHVIAAPLYLALHYDILLPCPDDDLLSRFDLTVRFPLLDTVTRTSVIRAYGQQLDAI